MKLTKNLFFILFIMITTACQSQTYTIETSLGNIQIRLYENTLLHKANFEKSVEENAYDSEFGN